MVTSKIRALLEPLAGKGVEFSVERPNQPEHGDFASNVAMVSAKAAGKNPRELAEQFKEKLSQEDLFESVSVAGPGFLNFRVAPEAWQADLREILDQGVDYGTFPKTGKKVQVEFVSANPTGPLTLANGRGGFGGDVLARVMARVGHEVQREYYINDSGNQIVGLGKTILGEEVVYAGDYIDDLRKRVGAKGSAKEVGQAAAAAMLEDIKQAVERMGISFDVWFSEQALYDSGRVERVLESLTAAGHTYEKDGALWLKTTEHGDDKDRAVRKSDGELTYLAADIAHYEDTMISQGFDRKINILGADHHGYVNRMQAAVEMLRETEPFSGESVILITQLVRLISGGKEVKMSKRAGTYVAVDDLLEQIPADVARFFFVMKSFETHMDFDLDLAKEQSQKNPVYYLKYAHARTASILAKADKLDEQFKLSLLTEPEELALIRELAEFPAVVAETAEDYQVQRVPHYALRLADAFHKFYERVRVISDDVDRTKARLKLVQGTKIVLDNIGDTLGIEMPDDM